MEMSKKKIPFIENILYAMCIVKFFMCIVLFSFPKYLCEIGKLWFSFIAYKL